MDSNESTIEMKITFSMSARIALSLFFISFIFYKALKYVSFAIFGVPVYVQSKGQFKEICFCIHPGSPTSKVPVLEYETVEGYICK